MNECFQDIPREMIKISYSLSGTHCFPLARQDPKVGLDLHENGLSTSSLWGCTGKILNTLLSVIITGIYFIVLVKHNWQKHAFQLASYSITLIPNSPSRNHGEHEQEVRNCNSYDKIHLHHFLHISTS